MHAQVPAIERLVFVDFLYKQVVNDPRAVWQQLCRRMATPYLYLMTARVREGDVWQRARAVRTLAELAGPEHTGAIVDALDDPAEHVAQTAARAYARLGLGPIEALLQRLDRYQPWDRRLLRQTLASVGPDGAPALLRTLQDVTAPTHIRVICADALTTLNSESSNGAALQILREETDLELRAAGLRLLRGEVTEEQREAVRALQQSPDPVLQGQAVACLARIGDERDMIHLEAALDHTSPWVRFNAARGLKQRGAPVPALAGAGGNGQE
ncbi:MAG: hypothetical protein FIB01_12075 [Gemmatimonadetes bacterium]|nr:hypothetical protein [Gemmatimonadota bacterium]